MILFGLDVILLPYESLFYARERRFLFFENSDELKLGTPGYLLSPGLKSGLLQVPRKFL